MNSNRKLIFLLWLVITVLIIGSAVGGYLLVRHTSDLDQANSDLSGANDSLRRQLQEAKAAPTPTPVPPPLATPEPTPTPKATATPKATVTPTPAAKP
jgi:hypothetical protein